MKVALLSHRFGNIGHQFMAVGMEEILKKNFPDVSVTHFEQHRPFSVYPWYNPLRLFHFLPKSNLRTKIASWATDELVMKKLWRHTKALPFDLAIACGGPNIVRGAGHSTFMKLLFHHQLGAFYFRGVPVVDAAVGSCFPFTDSPERITDPVDREYFQKEFSYCAAVTVREKTAEKLWKELGANPFLLPCGALASGAYFERYADIHAKDFRSCLLINFQAKGANSDWNQGVNEEKWREVVKSVVTHYERVMPVRFLCHDEKEYRIAQGFQKPIHFPKTLREYADALQCARVGLVSRIHAALPLAGVGVSSLVIGTDSRLGTADCIGLPTRFVRDVSAESIIRDLDELLAKEKTERERLIVLREKTMNDYGALFSSILTKHGSLNHH